MARLIDADALMNRMEARLADIYTEVGSRDGYADGFEEGTVAVEDAPTVDAVEVVRCRDCKYWQDNNGGYPHEECRWGKNETPDPDDFCSYGVTVQEWIPVKDGLPKLIPCDAGTAYSEAVNVLTSGRKVLTAIWDGFEWTCDAEFWDAEDEEITHWTPVLLPLPEPPKGE